MYVCDTTHLYMCHDPFMYVTRLIHMRDTTHPSMCHDSFIYVKSLIHRQKHSAMGAGREARTSRGKTQNHRRSQIGIFHTRPRARARSVTRCSRNCIFFLAPYPFFLYVIQIDISIFFCHFRHALPLKLKKNNNTHPCPLSYFIQIEIFTHFCHFCKALLCIFFEKHNFENNA